MPTPVRQGCSVSPSGSIVPGDDIEEEESLEIQGCRATLYQPKG